MTNTTTRASHLDQIRGSMWGGAIGDTLGYPVEFLNEEQIRSKYGAEGITAYQYDPIGGKALISDDTQMTLFTANGILVGETRLRMHGIGGIPHTYVPKSYRDWLCTQEMSYAQMQQKRQEEYYAISWLCDVPELYSPRAPGNTCISAIRLGKIGTVDEPINNSKGCGGIMRIAPLALHYNQVPIADLDREGAELAAITHGHSLGYMPAAALTHILSRIVYGDKKRPLKDIVIEARNAVHILFSNDRHIGELDHIIDQAIELSENDASDIDNIHRLGEGWVAEETLAIAVYCSLRHQDDFSQGVIAAVNHNGDSDSTGAVTGNILGALLGYEAIDSRWKNNLELADVIDEMAGDICQGCTMSEYDHNRDPEWVTKYMDMRWPRAQSKAL